MKISMSMIKSTLKTKSPKILMGLGIFSSVGAVALTIAGTVKVRPVIDEHKVKIKTINKQHKNGQKLIFKDDKITAVCAYTDKEYRKDLMREYAKASLHVLACYGGAICAEALSLICFILSYTKMSKRAAGYAAALASVSAAFESYRKRVAKVIGEDEEKKLFEGVEKKVIEKEDGTTEEVDIHPLNPEELYTFSLRDSCNYSPKMSYNSIKYWVDGVQSLLNRKYRTYFYDTGLYLNQALFEFGIDTVPYGQVVGWKGGLGDDCILVTLKEVKVEENGKLVSDYRISFNVAGDILTEDLAKIGGKK